ncbi:MAG: hypothetical protein WA672_10955 [Candidatus Angelobacter sp.]
MSQATTSAVVLPIEGRQQVWTAVEALSVPWTLWLTVSGVAVIMLGGIWDFAWHMSIGRDSLWVPPHVTVQLGAILVAITCVAVILATTVDNSSPARDTSIAILGVRAPAGAFIALWGSVAMFASEPFDNWWHNAFGLDVKLITPPHSLLFLGSFAVKIGAMAWIGSTMGRSTDALRERLSWLFLFVGAVGVMQFSNAIVGSTRAANMHTAACYLVTGFFVPPILVAGGWGAVHKWGCTIAAAIYTFMGLGFEWLLPLIPAQPKLGPVYHTVTHLIPMRFPLLLIIPAIVVDLLLQHRQTQSAWTKAAYVGPAFLLSFLAVQWPFANFLLSPASRNWIFGTAYFAYSDPAGILFDPYKFEPAGKAFLPMIAIAFLISIVATRLGLGLGNWMRRVQR